MNNLYTNKKIILKRLFLILSAFFAVLSAKGQSEDGIKLDAVSYTHLDVYKRQEQKILNRLEFFHSLKKKKKRLIVGVLGCMAERVKDDLITNCLLYTSPGPK